MYNDDVDCQAWILVLSQGIRFPTRVGHVKYGSSLGGLALGVETVNTFVDASRAVIL